VKKKGDNNNVQTRIKNLAPASEMRAEASSLKAKLGQPPKIPRERRVVRSKKNVARPKLRRPPWREHSSQDHKKRGGGYRERERSEKTVPERRQRNDLAARIQRKRGGKQSRQKPCRRQINSQPRGQRCDQESARTNGYCARAPVWTTCRKIQIARVGVRSESPDANQEEQTFKAFNSYAARQQSLAVEG